MRQAVTVMKAACQMKKWNVKPGDRVQPGDLLCTVSVGKLNREVTSKLAGTVLELAIPEGAQVPGGAAVCYIDAAQEAGEQPAPAAAAPQGPVALKMPKTGGPSTVKKWYKRPGDRVEAGEPVVSVTAGKLNRDLCSPCAGVLEAAAAPEGAAAPQPGESLAAIRPEAPAPASAPAAPAAEAAGGAPAGPAGLTPVELPAQAGKVATLKKWLKQPGDPVEAGEPLAELIAGKLNLELASPARGKLARQEAQEGATVRKGQPLCWLKGAGDAPAAAAAPAPAGTTLLVIGGGPGGYVAAIRAAQLGAQVTLVEEHKIGGTCLNVGCIPTKALLHSAELYTAARTRCAAAGVQVQGVSLDWTGVQQNRAAAASRLSAGVQALLAANGVTVVEGRASFTGPKQVRVVSQEGERTLTADRILIAAGSVPAIPPIPGLAENPNCIDSTGALELEALPESLVIVGGGVIGVELACAYAQFGTQVTVVEMLPRILPPMDGELAAQAQTLLEGLGITFHLSTQVLRFEQGAPGVQVVAQLPDGRELSLAAQKALVAVGRRANTAGLGLEAAGIETQRGRIVVNDRMETSQPGVYAIGDCVGRTMLAHAASAMGEVAAENALGHPARYDERVCPSGVYMAPELSQVGLTEEAARERGLDYLVGRFPMAANGKAVIMGEPEGLVKVLADRKTGKLLGVGILGPRATDLIAEAAVALQLGATLEDLIQTIHAHPTVSEAVREAALDARGRAIHFK